MAQRRKERLGGALIALLGVLLASLNWSVALHQGYFFVKAAALGPAIAFIGLALVVVPSYRLERLARGEDITTLQGGRLVTVRCWVITAIAPALGFADIHLLQ